MNGYYTPEGTKSEMTSSSSPYMSNSQLYVNTSTESLYQQLKVRPLDCTLYLLYLYQAHCGQTHVELAHRACSEVVVRKTKDTIQMKKELQKRLEDQKSLYVKQLTEMQQKHKRTFDRLKHDTDSKIKTLDIQLAERVVENNTLTKSYNEKFDSLTNQLDEKTQRIHKIEADYEELQRKYTEIQNEKQELQHEFNNLNEQVQRSKTMMLPLGSNKKRRVTEML